MANICYTQYRVEGPTEGIKQLAKKINGDLHGGYHNGSCRWFLYGHQMNDIEVSDIQPMNNGWSVLSFEAPSKWSPCDHEWKAYIHKVVSDAVIYYYGEEFACNVCMTNDVFYKYFKFDFVTVLRKSEQTPEKILDYFTEMAEYREREDQYKEYITYWREVSLRRALLKFVPFRRRDIRELIERMDVLMDEEDWRETIKTHLGIYIVKRLEEKEGTLCTHCTDMQNLMEENFRLERKVGRLESILYKMFYRRHTKNQK